MGAQSASICHFCRGSICVMGTNALHSSALPSLPAALHADRGGLPTRLCRSHATSQIVRTAARGDEFATQQSTGRYMVKTHVLQRHALWARAYLQGPPPSAPLPAPSG